MICFPHHSGGLFEQDFFPDPHSAQPFMSQFKVGLFYPCKVK